MDTGKELNLTFILSNFNVSYTIGNMNVTPARLSRPRRSYF